MGRTFEFDELRERDGLDAVAALTKTASTNCTYSMLERRLRCRRDESAVPCLTLMFVGYVQETSRTVNMWWVLSSMSDSCHLCYFPWAHLLEHEGAWPAIHTVELLSDTSEECVMLITGYAMFPEMCHKVVTVVFEILHFRWNKVIAQSVQNLRNRKELKLRRWWKKMTRCSRFVEACCLKFPMDFHWEACQCCEQVGTRAGFDAVEIRFADNSYDLSYGEQSDVIW
jgi:hypothetical protein